MTLWMQNKPDLKAEGFFPFKQLPYTCALYGALKKENLRLYL